jgi:hypothetical protein
MFIILENKKPKPERKKLPVMPSGLNELLNKSEISFKEVFEYND